MLATAILLAALMPAAADTPPDVALHFETVRAPSVGELDRGEVTHSRDVTIPAGDRFVYEYTDPRDGNTYALAVRLTPLSGDAVAAAVDWRNKATGEVRMHNDDLAVDGHLTLSLHPLADREGFLFLRLSPTVVPAER